MGLLWLLNCVDFVHSKDFLPGIKVILFNQPGGPRHYPLAMPPLFILYTFQPQCYPLAMPPLFCKKPFHQAGHAYAYAEITHSNAAHRRSAHRTACKPLINRAPYPIFSPQEIPRVRWHWMWTQITGCGGGCCSDLGGWEAAEKSWRIGKDGQFRYLLQKPHKRHDGAYKVTLIFGFGSDDCNFQEILRAA